MQPDILQNFNFADPAWLWGLVLAPLLWGLYALLFHRRAGDSDIRSFADAHLLPHLLATESKYSVRKADLRKPLALWSLIWALGILAMAGPRWDYIEIKAFAPARDLVVLLELSPSMDAQDVKPSRLARAREEIEDIAEGAKAVNLGLVVFDSVPHMITPLTDDRQTLIHLLPSINTGLSYVPGANLAPALQMAGDMLSSSPGGDKNILIIGDGGFQDSDAALYRAERRLATLGTRVSVMGVGTSEGAPAPDGKNGFIHDGAAVKIFHLDEQALRDIASDGHGIYTTADYFDAGTKTVLAQVDKPAASGAETGKTAKIWDEQFYLFLLPAALLLLPWFRRNAAFPLALAFCLFLHAPAAHASDWRDLFRNRAQQGQQALDDKQYDRAVQKFDDPYRRGVAQYRAGKYDEAEKSFAAASRPDIADSARYDLGNAQLMGGKVKDAIATYEDILKKNPQQDNARHNLEIAKKMLEQQQKQQSQNDQNKQDQQQNQDQNQSQSQKQDQKQDQSQKQDQQNKQDQQSQSAQQQKQDEQNKQDQQSQSAQQQKQDEQNKQDQQSQSAQQQKQDEQNKQDQQSQSAQQQKQDEQNKQDQQSQSAQQQKQDEQDKQDQLSQSAQQQKPADENGDDGLTPRPEAQPEPGTLRDVRRTAKDVNADQWLDRIQNDPESFLKNKFYIETVRQSKKEEETP